MTIDTQRLVAVLEQNSKAYAGLTISGILGGVSAYLWGAGVIEAFLASQVCSMSYFLGSCAMDLMEHAEKGVLLLPKNPQLGKEAVEDHLAPTPNSNPEHAKGPAMAPLPTLK